MEKETSSPTASRDFYGVFWLFNLIYTFLYWHSLPATIANIFLPYAFVVDLVHKVGPVE